jgi:cytochrome c553
MRTLLYITQLPEYRKQLIRHMDVLDVAEGFTDQDKADLSEIYQKLLNKIDTILATDIATINPIEVTAK